MIDPDSREVDHVIYIFIFPHDQKSDDMTSSEKSEINLQPSDLEVVVVTPSL